MGDVYGIRKDFESALIHYKRAKEILINNFRNDHLFFPIVCIKLGKIYQALDDHAQAIDEYKQAMEILKPEMGDEESDLNIENLLSMVYISDEGSRAVD